MFCGLDTAGKLQNNPTNQITQRDIQRLRLSGVSLHVSLFSLGYFASSHTSLQVQQKHCIHNPELIFAVTLCFLCLSVEISHQRYALAGTNFEYAAPAAAGDQCVAFLHGYDRCDIQYFIKAII